VFIGIFDASIRQKSVFVVISDENSQFMWVWLESEAVPTE
jgi:hypothetical protein